MMGFLREFYEYVERKEKDILKDGLGFFVCLVYVSIDEIVEVSKKIVSILEFLRNNLYEEGRRMYFIGVIIILFKEDEGK